VLFFIEVRTRRFVAGCTAHPTTASVTHQARSVLRRRLDAAGVRPTVLVRDRDAKFPRAFDDVFRSEGARVVRAPDRAPLAKARAERWIRTVRRECLDWLFILGRRHLEQVLHEYADHDNASRPHRVCLIVWTGLSNTSGARPARAGSGEAGAVCGRGDRPPRPPRRTDPRVRAARRPTIATVFAFAHPTRRRMPRRRPRPSGPEPGSRG
jgi:hypothetical protein